MRKFIPLFCALSLAGCVSVPAVKQPSHELPAAWPTPPISLSLSQTLAKSEPAKPAATIGSEWWLTFQNPALDTLIREALANNQDLQQAAARVLEAEANLKSADAARLPSVDASFSTSRNRRGQETSPAVPGTYYNSNTLNVAASYEIDLWGRLRAASEAARADLLASREAGEVVRLTLTHNVAQAWFSLNALAARVSLSRATLANRQAAASLMEKRLQAGVVSELEWRQAEAEVAGLQSSLALLDLQMAQQEHALAVLLGRSPRALVEARINAPGTPVLAVPPEVPAGLPSELLQRRPDLKQAEAALVSAQARIQEARAALFPSLTLTADLGSASKSLSDLLSNSATTWGLGLGLAQSLFSGGSTEAAIAARSARQDQALASYQSATRQAFREVLDALVANRQNNEIWLAENKRVEALGHAARIAEARFNAGSASQMEVLDTQRNLYNAEQALIDARRARLASAASLIKVLGGGWRATP